MVAVGALVVASVEGGARHIGRLYRCILYPLDTEAHRRRCSLCGESVLVAAAVPVAALEAVVAVLAVAVTAVAVVA